MRVAARSRILAVTSVAGTALLGLSFSAEPGSRRFYGYSLSLAGTWLAGGLSAGAGPPGPPRPGVVSPVLTGAGAFGGFYAAALVARRIPPLRGPISSVLRYAHQGSDRKVLITTLVNGAAEEVFFRGALYRTLDRPVPQSTAGYVLATCATGNPALALASGVMGIVLARQRQNSGGLQAPILTHLTWSALMLRYLPSLFPPSEILPGEREE
ncbi:MAG TPA: CPBP family intramembrane glutamic endopeptidase [Mycobacteriales bacterium]|nr:CPBP family intramembrane glutamic endopeptidase [Mycobacteriales bacterium]